jgi:uncharacterized protein with PQ loop repeat
MVLILAAGIALWVIYGVLRRDIVIVLANAVSFILLSGILFFKLREMWTTNRAKRGTARLRKNGALP